VLVVVVCTCQYSVFRKRRNLWKKLASTALLKFCSSNYFYCGLVTAISYETLKELRFIFSRLLCAS
jgi:hypothetical protein